MFCPFGFVIGDSNTLGRIPLFLRLRAEKAQCTRRQSYESLVKGSTGIHFLVAYIIRLKLLFLGQNSAP